MTRVMVDRQLLVDAENSAEHALFHLKQSNLDDEGQHAVRNIAAAMAYVQEALGRNKKEDDDGTRDAPR